MKKKFTVVIADVEMNVLTDAPTETVEKIVGMLDRRMRDIHLKSNRCTKNQAALLCALDYSSERIKAQRKVKSLETRLATTEIALEDAERENEELRSELETLKMMVAK